MEEIAYKSRTQGAVGSERMQLLCIIAHFWDELQRYESEGGSQKQKWDLWETIAGEFNSLPNMIVVRSPLQVKTLFKNMKTKAKKYKQRVEEAMESGMSIEPDPISETVLQLNKRQSKTELYSILEPLKNLYYLSRNPMYAKPVTIQNETNNQVIEPSKPNGDNVLEVNNSSHEKKLEALQNKDSSHTIASVFISEDSNTLRDENNSLLSPASSEDTAQVHTFGDISVTPISSDKKEAAITNPFRPLILSTSRRNNTTKVTLETAIDAPLTISNLHQHQPRKLLPRNCAVKRPSPEVLEAATSQKHELKNSAFNTHPSSAKFLTDKHCCCPDYHRELLQMAQKEHEMKTVLLSEEIMCERAERSLHEEKRRVNEQNFLFRKKEGEESLKEHKAKLRVIELESEVVQATIRNEERTNRWLLKNYSKEI